MKRPVSPCDMVCMGHTMSNTYHVVRSLTPLNIITQKIVSSLKVPYYIACKCVIVRPLPLFIFRTADANLDSKDCRTV